MMNLKFMSTIDCLYSFNLCLMGLGCPLLRGSSDRRLCRCAATLPPLLERTFPGSSLSSDFGALTVAMQGLEEENVSVGVRHLRKKYRCQSSCETLPSCLGAYVHWRRRYWGWF